MPRFGSFPLILAFGFEGKGPGGMTAVLATRQYGDAALRGQGAMGEGTESKPQSRMISRVSAS